MAFYGVSVRWTQTTESDSALHDGWAAKPVRVKSFCTGMLLYVNCQAQQRTEAAGLSHAKEDGGGWNGKKGKVKGQLLHKTKPHSKTF